MYERERPMREGTTTAQQRRKTPSFSSSLLDAIYRSIDEPSPKDQVSGFDAEAPTIKKQSSRGFDDKQRRPSSSSCCSYSSSSSSLQPAILIDEWVEKRSTPNSNFSLNSASISSSDSSSGATFSSSSEPECSRSSCRSYKPTPQQVDSGKSFYFDPIRNLETPRKKIHRDDEVKNGVTGGFTKTKLRALKIYGELKNLKQPISPGARISNFLNSIFNSGNVKKAKMCYVGAVEDVSFERKSKPAYSSASSFSRRSCMTKSQTPSTSSSSSSSFSGRNKMKRSVRFYPVSVIVGEDSRPCGHRPIYENDGRFVPAPARRAQDAIKSSSSSAASRGRGIKARFQECEEEEDEDEDAESCASSDLFELDHLIGVGRYRDELPVYETTCLRMNQAIASGMKL